MEVTRNSNDEKDALMLLHASCVQVICAEIASHSLLSAEDAGHVKDPKVCGKIQGPGRV